MRGSVREKSSGRAWATRERSRFHFKVLRVFSKTTISSEVANSHTKKTTSWLSVVISKVALLETPEALTVEGMVKKKFGGVKR